MSIFSTSGPIWFSGDGGASVGTATKTIHLVAVDDPATMAGDPASQPSLSYTSGTPAISLNPAGTLKNPDSPGRNLAGVTLNAVWTAGGALAGNRLFIAAGATFLVDYGTNQVKLASSPSTVIANFNVGGGVGSTDLNITFTAAADVSLAQTLHRQICFRTTAGATAGQRQITLTLDDGGDTSSVLNTIDVT